MTLRPQKPARQRGFILATKAEKLIMDLAPAINRMPKSQRYRFALRLENELWELVRRLFEAACSGTKSKVYRADEQVRLLHALLRHAAENRTNGGKPLLSGKRVGDAAEQLGEIGRMIKAWRHKIEHPDKSQRKG